MFARGKYAKAISDRSGMAFPYNEMVKEWNGSFTECTYTRGTNWDTYLEGKLERYSYKKHG